MYVYLTGEEGHMTKPTVWRPGEYHDFLLRMDWPGTGSCPADPLIDAKRLGEYWIGVTLVLKNGDHAEYCESPAMDVTVVEAKKVKE